MYYLAPNVVINGELTVLENADIILTCDYADVLPQGNQSSFTFRELSAVLNKVQSVQRLINQTFLGKCFLNKNDFYYSSRSDGRVV